MLVLTRKPRERVLIGKDIVVTVLRIKGNAVQLGIEAPDSVKVMRTELIGQDGPQRRAASILGDRAKGADPSATVGRVRPVASERSIALADYVRRRGAGGMDADAAQRDREGSADERCRAPRQVLKPLKTRVGHAAPVTWA